MTKLNTSLRVRIAVWFALNPDEILSASDAAAKFDVDRTQSYDSFSSLRRDGFVERIDGSYPRQWKAGPAIVTMQQQAGSIKDPA